MANELVTNLKVQTDDAVNPLRQLEEQAKGSDDAMAAMADSIANGLTDISDRAGRAFGRLADGATVSQSAFDGVISKVDALKSQVVETFGGLENAPEPFRNAVKAAEDTARSLSEEIVRQKERLATLRDAYGQTATKADDAADATKRLGEEEKRVTDTTAELGDEAAKTGAALDGLASTGKTAADEMRASTLTFEQAATGAANRVTEAWESFNKEQRLTPGQINAVAQAVEVLKITMQQQADAGVAATAEQLAQYERLEGQLGELTARANQLTNAARDNAIRLQESGTQVDGLASAVQSLASLAGPAGAKIGAVAGQAGNLASTAQNAKSAIEAMNVNTLSASASSGTLAVQLGAVAAALYVAVQGGSALAETNAANRDTIDDLVTGVKTLLPNLAELRSKLDGIQTAGQNAQASLTSGEFRGAANDLTAMAIAAGKGRQEMALFYDLLRQGFSTLEATRIAADDNRAALEAYNQAREQGGRSQELWNQAVRTAAGDAETLSKRIDFLKRQLDDEKTRIEATTEAQKENNAAKREAISIAEQKADSIGRLLSVEEQALQIVSSAQIHLAQATNGTSLAINQALTVISAYIAESDRHAIALGNEAAALQQALNMTDGLTKAERERIQAVIDLAKNANDLTVAEQNRGKELAAAIISGKAAAAAVKEQAEALTALREATTAAADAERNATVETDAHTKSIRAQIDAIDAQLDRMGATAEATGALAETDQFAGASADFLRMKREALVRELEVGLSVVRAALDVTNEESDARAKLAGIIEQERAAQANVRTTTEGLHTVIEHGRTVYTNLSDAQREAAKATSSITEAQRQAADATIKVTSATEGVMIGAAAAAEVMNKLAPASVAAGQGLEELARQAPAAAKAVEDLADAASGALPASLENAAGATDRLVTNVRQLIDLLPSLREQVVETSRAADGLGESFSRAAGDPGSSYVNVTEAP